MIKSNINFYNSSKLLVMFVFLIIYGKILDLNAYKTELWY